MQGRRGGGGGGLQNSTSLIVSYCSFFSVWPIHHLKTLLGKFSLLCKKYFFVICFKPTYSMYKHDVGVFFNSSIITLIN